MLPTIRVVGLNVKQGEVGVHLIEPTLPEIDAAMETAIAKGFKTVFVHRELRNGI